MILSGVGLTRVRVSEQDSPRVTFAETPPTPDPSPPLRSAKRGEGRRSQPPDDLTGAGDLTLLPASACERRGGATAAAKRRRAGWGVLAFLCINLNSSCI